MNRVVSSREQSRLSGPPVSPLVGFDRLWAELKQREARLASCCGQQQDPTPTIFRDPSRLPKVSETMRKDPMPPPGPTPSVWVEYERRQAREQARQAKGSAEEGDCACQEPKAKPRRAGPDASGVRMVSGEWISRVLSLPEETRERLLGLTVRVGTDAWHALRATQESGPTWRRIRRDVAKRRARFWPEEAEPSRQAESRNPSDWSKGKSQGIWSAQPGSAGSAPSCDCVAVVAWEYGARFVDAEEGDDEASGGMEVTYEHDESIPGHPVSAKVIVRPWRTIKRAVDFINERALDSMQEGVCWEGVGVYLRRGRTWTGREEGARHAAEAGGLPGGVNRWTYPGENAYGVEAVHEITGFKGTEDSPLVIAAYGEGDDPLLDGSALPPTEPQYGDGRRAFFISDCCYLQMQNIRIRGFNQGIGVTGASKDHLYYALRLFENSGTGIGFGISQMYAEAYRDSHLEEIPTPDLADMQGARLSEWLARQGVYPEDIKITDCTIWSIGYDTGNQGIGLGHLSTNCSILRNHIRGDSVRGVDGITGNGASSGHLIEGNTISDHQKLCRTTTMEVLLSSGSSVIPVGAVFAAAPSCPGAAEELRYRCDGSNEAGVSCSETEYGYAMTQVAAGDGWTGGDTSAFGEDGIDLKGVRKRTPTSTNTTAVCENTIYGNGGFSGISVADGSQGIHICRNRIFLNAVGILVANGEDDAWFQSSDYYEDKTSHVYIYRNLIHMNREFGIKVTSTYQAAAGAGVVSFDVEEVYIINNTIAHNLFAGLDVAVDSATPASSSGIPPVDGIHIHNNLFIRNNVNVPPRESNVSVQVSWSQIYPTDGGQSMGNNVYVGWAENLKELSKVISVPGQNYRLDDFQTDYPGFEVGGQHTDAVQDVHPVDWVYFVIELATRSDLETVVDAESRAVIAGLDYDLYSGSICLDNADASYMKGVVDAFSNVLDIGMDLTGVHSDEFDVGAFNGPEES